MFAARKYDSLEVWQSRAAGLFGPPHKWRFRCPVCGNVATPAEFKALGADPQLAAQHCIGRHMGGRLAFGNNPAGTPTRPCNYAAYGLFASGVTVPVNGKLVNVLPFDEQLQVEVSPDGIELSAPVTAGNGERSL